MTLPFCPIKSTVYNNQNVTVTSLYYNRTDTILAICLSFCIMWSYATWVWPEFIFNKVMFCFVQYNRTAGQLIPCPNHPPR